MLIASGYECPYAHRFFLIGLLSKGNAHYQHEKYHQTNIVV